MSELSVVPIYEGMPHMTEAIEFYEACGFEISGLFPVTRDVRTGRIVELDCIMVRADSVRWPLCVS